MCIRDRYNFEIQGKLLETGDGVDVNPADYIVHVLQSVGADVVIDGIDNFRAYCKAADILISTPPNQKSAKAQQVINDIAEITNSCLLYTSKAKQEEFTKLRSIETKIRDCLLYTSTLMEKNEQSEKARLEEIEKRTNCLLYTSRCV